MLLAVQAWLKGRGQKPIGVWVLALGVCMTLGYAPFGLWPVAVLSLAGLWWLVVHAQSRKQAAGAALVWGMGHGISALYWLPWAFYKDADGSWAAAIGGGGSAVVGLAFYGALTYVIASVLAWQVSRKSVRAGALVWVLALVVIEFIKGLSPLGFPWLPVGAIFGKSLTLMQFASVGGVWLLSFFALAMAVLVSAGTRKALTLACVVLVMMAGYGTYRLHAPQRVFATTEMIRVVQPNITSAHKWDAQKRWEFLQETLNVGLAGDPSRSTPRTIIMPETAVAFYLDEEDDVRKAVASRLTARMPEDGALVTGTVRREVSDTVPPTEHYFNSLTVMDPKGILRGMYDKRLLVPFGEYIPARSVLDSLPLPTPVRVLSQSRIDFTHGSRSPVLDTPAGYAVGLICYEGIFPLQVAEAAAGSNYLVNITNDGWFTGTIALYQHAALARLRAVETGLPMVRVANTGLTLVYDGLGREVARLPINIATYADVPLPAQQLPTPLVRMVHWFTPHSI